jgi:hypothetical protein
VLTCQCVKLIIQVNLPLNHIYTMYLNHHSPRPVGLPASPRLRLPQDRHESHTPSQLVSPAINPGSSRLRHPFPAPSSDQRDSSSTFRSPRMPENRVPGKPESSRRAYLQTSSRPDTSSSYSSSASSSLLAARSQLEFSASDTSLEEDMGTPKQDRPGMSKLLFGYYPCLASSLRIRTR